MTGTMTDPTAPALSALDPVISHLLQECRVDASGTDARAFGTDLHEDSPGMLARSLAHVIYRIVHAGITAVPDGSEAALLHEDTLFEEQLVSQTATLERVRHVRVYEDLPGHAGSVVDLQGVRVFIPADRILERAGEGATVRLRSTARRLSLGFMFYTSRMGAGTAHRPVRLYRHARHGDDAARQWRALTTWTEENAVRLRAKVLSRTSDYPRNDAIVVYLPAESWHRVGELADVLASDDPHAVTSPFTRRLRPGVSLAWEPADPAVRHGSISFGEHRSQIIAAALVEARGDAQLAVDAIRRGLLAANVDPSRIYQNLDSPPLRW